MAYKQNWETEEQKNQKKDRPVKKSLLERLSSTRNSRAIRAFSMLLAAITVFGTTYGMVMPAITVDQESAEEMPGIYLEEDYAAGTDYEEGYEETVQDPVDEGAYEDGIQDTADEAVYEDGIQDTADEAVYEDGIQDPADGSAYEDGIQDPADEAVFEDGEGAPEEESTDETYTYYENADDDRIDSAADDAAVYEEQESDVRESADSSAEVSNDTYQETRLETAVPVQTALLGDVTVRIDYTSAAMIPDGSMLSASEVDTNAETEEEAAQKRWRLEHLENAADVLLAEIDSDWSWNDASFFDVELTDPEGNVLQPGSQIYLTVYFTNPVYTDKVRFVRFYSHEETEYSDVETPELMDPVDLGYTEDGGVYAGVFLVDSLSPFGVLSGDSLQAMEEEMISAEADSVLTESETESMEEAVPAESEAESMEEAVPAESEAELAVDAPQTESETESAAEAVIAESDTESAAEAVLTESAAELAAEPVLEEVEVYPAQSFRGSTETVNVTVLAPEGAFPADTTMTVEDVPDRVVENITEAVSDGTTTVNKVHAVDITFRDNNGTEIEPLVPVKVTITAEKKQKTEDALVVHVTDEGTVEQIEDAVISERNGESRARVTMEAAAAESAAQTDSGAEAIPEAAPESLEGTEDHEVVADAFSVYAIVYTVDFQYTVDGKTYKFSIPGGGFVTLRQLVEVLGIADCGTNDEADAQEEDTQADKKLMLADVDICDRTKEFVADVENVEFSDPDLAWIGKADKTGTVGGLKEANGLECQYSAELTEEQITEINTQTVVSGDWALISKQPFTSEETLTVTMKNGDQFAVKVTDAQISTHVLTADGERFRITITYDEDAKIPKGSVLVAEEIPEGSEKYEQYLEETTEKWEEDDKEGYISFARFFDIEIRKDGRKIEPEAAVEVEIEHEDGLRLSNDESFSVIHFADDGTEIIDELHLNETGTEVFYNQDSFSVIGTVSTVKDSGWPTANGQYVLVLQDGDDYYALKQDGTLTKIRYFNNTVSFIGEGTTTTDYIKDYLWYVVSSGNRGKISDEYTEYNATPAGQTFIDLNNANIFSGTSRQLQINNGKIYCNGQLPGSSGYTQVTLSASGGQLSRVALTSDSASPAFFASASSFTANDNETDLFTQIEVESIIDKWKEQKTQESTYDKTAEVYDYENRIYRIDIAASSSDYEVAPSIALEFVVDASRSMFFPTSLTQVGTFSGTNASNVRDWINSNGDQNQVYFVIQNKDGAATQYAIFWDPNSSYEVDHGWWTETKYGQWLWCDASVYNPPDDVSNGGPHSSMQSGLPLSTWWYDSFDDGKIYTTGITGSSDGSYGTRKTWVSRIEYLKQCARVASQVIYAVDENAQIGLIGFNAKVKDYGTFGKSQQQELLDNIDNISLDGGTNHQAGLQKAIDKYQDASFYAQHYAGRKHVVVLVTDGAPNQTGVDWTTIGGVANTLKNLEDDFGHKTELYTMGLSLSNVGSNQSNLFNISSGSGYTYAAEDAAQIINAVTKIVDSIFVQANLVADVTDVIDPAFYPVNKTNGFPLAEDDWINLSGTKVNAGASDAAGQIKKDSATGNWYVEWKNQNIDWPTTDSNGAVTAPGWHGTVFVKAKEDFLGGNGINTNAEGSQLEAKKYIVRGETMPHDLPEGDHTEEFLTPYVNVDELDITKNDTEWTVYLGTNVDPLTELKALWEKVKVKEVVTKTDTDHRISSDGRLTYQYASNTNDDRQEANGREEFPISDLEITLTDDDWNDLIAGNAKSFTYNAYDHTRVGTITISLTQEVKEGEKNLSESPHDTTVVGDEVEKYTLTVDYRPKGANLSDWHTGSYGSGMSGNRAGNIQKDNIHIINVFVKGLQITKVDLNDQILPGAKFALYRIARDGETDDLLEIDGKQYYKIAELDTSSTGISVKEQIEQLKEGEQYYLVETQVPAGYITIAPIPVSLSISDVYTPKPGETTQTTKPETGIYDWTQNASLILSAESGVKRTDSDNTADLTHKTTADSNTEIIYYRITNNPGVALPNTGGPGTDLIYLLGSMLIMLASAGFILLGRKKRIE